MDGDARVAPVAFRGDAGRENRAEAWNLGRELERGLDRELEQFVASLAQMAEYRKNLLGIKKNC